MGKKVEDLGAGEILLTSVDNDGTMNGLDQNLIKEVTSLVSLPVIASGGTSSIKDISDATKRVKLAQLQLDIYCILINFQLVK